MAFANALSRDRVARPRKHQLGERRVEVSSPWAKSNAYSGGETDTGSPARGVIYAAIIGATLWAALLLML